MSLIPAENKMLLRRKLQENLKDLVRIVVFTQETECESCRDARQLVQEVASLFPDKISAEIYDFVKDEEKVREYGIDKVPAIAVVGKKDYGIRYYGIPYGYEFNTFIDTIINVSKERTNLQEETKKKLVSMEKPVHIRVFVTLTCPYCPIAAGLACQFAIESDLVRSDVINVTEFLPLGTQIQRYGCAKNGYKRADRTCWRHSRSTVCRTCSASTETTEHLHVKVASLINLNSMIAYMS